MIKNKPKSFYIIWAVILTLFFILGTFLIIFGISPVPVVEPNNVTGVVEPTY